MYIAVISLYLLSIHVEPATVTRHKRFFNANFLENLKEQIEAKIQAVLDNLDLPAEIQAVIDQIQAAKADALANLPTNINDVIAELQNLIEQLEAGVDLADIQLPNVDDVIAAVENARANLSELVPEQVDDVIAALQEIKNNA